MSALNGYFRPSQESLEFPHCSQVFSGMNANELAKKTCCPMEGNVSICEGSNFSHPAQQCQKGFSGALCAACADGFVRSGDDCVVCPEGARIGLVFAVLCGVCVPGFVVVVFVLLCSSTADRMEGTADQGSAIFGQIKILIAVSAVSLSLSLSLSLSFVDFFGPKPNVV